MEIPSITERQVHIMNNAVLNLMETFYVLVPDVAKDNPTEYDSFTKTNEDINALCELGFIEDITTASSPLITGIIKRSKDRECRVMRVSNIGLKFFDALGSKVVH